MKGIFAKLQIEGDNKYKFVYYGTTIHEALNNMKFDDYIKIKTLTYDYDTNTGQCESIIKEKIHFEFIEKTVKFKFIDIVEINILNYDYDPFPFSIDDNQIHIKNIDYCNSFISDLNYNMITLNVDVDGWVRSKINKSMYEMSTKLKLALSFNKFILIEKQTVKKAIREYMEESEILQIIIDNQMLCVETLKK